jgi:hypothetical protein
VRAHVKVSRHRCSHRRGSSSPRTWRRWRKRTRRTRTWGRPWLLRETAGGGAWRCVAGWLPRLCERRDPCLGRVAKAMTWCTATGMREGTQSTPRAASKAAGTRHLMPRILRCTVPLCRCSARPCCPPARLIRVVRRQEPAGESSGQSQAFHAAEQACAATHLEKKLDRCFGPAAAFAADAAAASRGAT